VSKYEAGSRSLAKELRDVVAKYDRVAAEHGLGMDF
jgi:hypothetical protein